MWRNCHIPGFNRAGNLHDIARLHMNPAIFVLTAAALLLGIGRATAAPNLADLSIFGGRVAGSSEVQLSNGAYHGKKAVIRPTIRGGGLAATFKVISSVKIKGHDVPISNEFTFTGSGKFLGRELAPETPRASA